MKRKYKHCGRVTRNGAKMGAGVEIEDQIKKRRPCHVETPAESTEEKITIKEGEGVQFSPLRLSTVQKEKRANAREQTQVQPSSRDIDNNNNNPITSRHNVLPSFLSVRSDVSWFNRASPYEIQGDGDSLAQQLHIHSSQSPASSA